MTNRLCCCVHLHTSNKLHLIEENKKRKREKENGWRGGGKQELICCGDNDVPCERERRGGRKGKKSSCQ